MRFYKITNEKETYFDTVYQTGLNIDLKGIYFANKDILAFFYFGPWIREVTLPEGEEIHKNPGKPVEYKACRVILGERRRITIEIIEELIKQGANICVKNNYPIRLASLSRQHDVANYLKTLLIDP
jgi:hypothetical protein